MYMKKKFTRKESLVIVSKSFFLLLFIFSFCISGTLAANNNPKQSNLTIQMQNKTIKEVFNYIEKNSKYIFVYLDNVVDPTMTVNVNVKNQPISVILDNVLQDTELNYKIDNRQITINREKVNIPAIVQQTIEVSGTVRDEVNEPVIGASVAVKGTTTGTMTDTNGTFRLNVPSTSSTLVISYIGYVTQEIQVSNQRNFQISLALADMAMQEVVVTALGIKRETKALGYGIQEIKGSSLTEARESNLLNSLSGKMAGVYINSSGNGMGGSSSIVIRGMNSLAGNNNPLVVVDGVPINNFNSGSSGADQWGGADAGNGLSDINPDDIESLSVLKGAAAAALYGTRAGNGVLMITTKKGEKSKGLGVSFNSNIMMETPLTKAKMQNVYGQGVNGAFDPNGSKSWGPKMEGQQLTDWTGQTRPFSSYDNDIMDFLGTGVTTNNTVSINSSTDKISFLGSLGYQRMDGAIPKNYQDKTTLNLRTTVNLSKKISLDTKINYVKYKVENRPQLTGSPESVMTNYLRMPRSVHYSDMKNSVDENGNVKQWTSEELNFVLNPYFVNEYNQKNDERDRFMGFLALQYDPTDWLTIKIRHGEDMYWKKNDWRHSSYTNYSTYRSNDTGDYGKGTAEFRERNTDALITASGNNLLGSKISGSLSFGGNLMNRKTDDYSMNSGILSVPDFFSINVGENRNIANSLSEKSINSLYGFAQLSYDNWVYLDITARNDWSSTLAKDNRSFFYPSFSMGWVVSDMLKSYNVKLPDFISFAKLRGSYAQVGNDTNPYSLIETYGIIAITDGINGAVPSSEIPLYNLKPEKIKSTELGFDFRFFENRLGIDFSWYTKDATNQIISLPISSTTGKTTRRINAGSIQNKGIELVLNGTPLKKKNFEWNVTLNYAKNTNKIKKLHPEIKNYYLGGTQYLQLVATEGGSYGDIQGYPYQRDDQGRILVDGNGIPLLQDTEEMQTIGNYMPKWTGSLINSFTYKNLSFGFMLDMRYGGDIYINSLAISSAYGTSLMSLEGREGWYASETARIAAGVSSEEWVPTGGILINGVTSDGQVNTRYADPVAYWDRMQRSGERFLYKGTNLRLREVTIGYTFPRKILSKTPFTSLKLSAVGRNLLLLQNKVKGGYDPESSYNTGTAQGIEYASFPSMRSFGLNLNISF